MPVRDGRLVCQHLESIGRDLLGDYPEIIRSMARGRHGIYALYRRDRLYYLGLAANLRQRLTQHLRGRLGGSWDRFSLYLTVDDRYLREMEALFVRIGKPRGNRARPRLERSENLGPELRRRITEKQRQQRDHILGRAAGGDRGGGTSQEARPTTRAAVPALWRYVTKRMEIRLLHKGQTHVASVHRDGTIHYQGRVFASPSGAARAITGVAANGWRVWQYQRSGAEWVPLRTLRRQTPR